MKVLFIGGTGVISTACVRLAVERGMDVSVLNRGTTGASLPPGVRSITADIRDEPAVLKALGTETFDVVANFVSYNVADVERDIRLWGGGRAGQYVFISSASAYQVPPTNYRITESTPLANNYWDYSKNKIAAELRLNAEHRANGFPVLIVRPSLTYGDTLIPMSITSWEKSWTLADRMLRGKPILIHGDGTNLMTCTHNTDFAKGFLGLFGDVRVMGHAVHITSDEVLTWNQHYQILADVLGVKPRFVHVASATLAAFDPKWDGWLLGNFANTAVYDNAKIKSLVPDYVATVPFKRGIAQTVAAFRADPARQVLDPEFDAWCDRVVAAVDAFTARKI